MLDFNDYKYCPAVRSRPAELHGIKNLFEHEKDEILPIITLCAWPRHDGVERQIAEIQEAIGDRPFLMDLSSDAIHQNPSIHQLRRDTENFESWRSFVSLIRNAVPVVQITSTSKVSQVIRQTRALEQTAPGQVAFRVSGVGNGVDKVVAALAAMDSTDKGLVIVDAGYARETMAVAIANAANAINAIREDIDDAIIAVISSSFPASVTPYLDPGSEAKRGIIDQLERALHQEIGGSKVAIYGDYASIHAKAYSSPGGRYVRRIDYPVLDAWAFERRPEQTSIGYIDAAQALIKNYPEIETDESWGAQMIRRAANGEIEGMKTPSSWIAARVNMHISKQLRLSLEVEDDEDFDLFT